MKVVVNATPLIALAILQRLELLPQLFDEVFVPPIVFQEVVIQGINQSGRAFNCFLRLVYYTQPICLLRF